MRYEIWAKVPATEGFKEVTGISTVPRFEKSTTSEEVRDEVVAGLKAVGIEHIVREYPEEGQ